MSMGNEFLELIAISADPPITLCHSDSEGGRTVEVALVSRTPLAVACQSITLSSSMPPFDVQANAAQLAKKLSYLSEPIRVLEFDALAKEALLRSDPPKTTADGPAYFEITMSRQGRTVLQRYQQSPESSREALPFTLTLETLSRVIDDMAAR